MKTFVLVSCLLVFTQIIYAVDIKELKIMNRILEKCIRTVPKGENDPINPLKNVNVLYCAFSKRGIFTPKGVNTKQYINYCEKTIINPADIKQCKKLISKCIKKVYDRPGPIIERSKNLLSCVLKKGVLELTVYGKKK
uniref:Venom allergen 4 n=1 Tax=Solenopsis geminata TaxID=121131 RepID=VA4_SOLGE|nr:RecName: Full=Venom allergen 4; AltName: Full=Venom allergen IV; AltName: Allergen=Sol g 4; Flags: Precursor [Solenopsis geminata]AAF65312.1 venom allergen Sol g 4.01 precursor [Solenopsis geminata]